MHHILMQQSRQPMQHQSRLQQQQQGFAAGAVEMLPATTGVIFS